MQLALLFMCPPGSVLIVSVINAAHSSARPNCLPERWTDPDRPFRHVSIFNQPPTLTQQLEPNWFEIYYHQKRNGGVSQQQVLIKALMATSVWVCVCVGAKTKWLFPDCGELSHVTRLTYLRWLLLVYYCLLLHLKLFFPLLKGQKSAEDRQDRLDELMYEAELLSSRTIWETWYDLQSRWSDLNSVECYWWAADVVV